MSDLGFHSAVLLSSTVFSHVGDMHIDYLDLPQKVTVAVLFMVLLTVLGLIAYVRREMMLLY